MTRKDLASRLDEARRELLDLGLRNPLINFRSLKSRGVDITDEKSDEIFRILVGEGRSMTFLDVPETFRPSDESSDSELVFEQPVDETNGTADRHVDSKLQTPYSSVQLQRRLLNTFYSARTFIEEQGLNVLYLALGMLHWHEDATPDVIRRAPLILIPVELQRSDVRSRFKLKYTGDDIGDNLSLLIKLKTEFQITLPEIDSDGEFDVAGYFRAVNGSIRSRPGWSVEPDELALGFFQYGKILMYNDLDATTWPEDPEGPSRLLVGLLGAGFSPPNNRISADEHLDEYLDPSTVHHVMDADGSQTLALLDIKQGHDLVIQGPPGTGKSQTITNIIADALGENKTVLFVSEKMAALEVVKRRLDSIHLGDACLELHSHKSRKKEVLDELERTLAQGRPAVSRFEDNFDILRQNKRTLNHYCDALNTPVRNSNSSPFQLYGNLVRLRRELGEDHPDGWESPEMLGWTSTEFESKISQVGQLQALIRRMGPPSRHPLWGSRLSVATPATIEKITRLAQRTLFACDDLISASSDLCDLTGIGQNASSFHTRQGLRAASYAKIAPALDGIDLALSEWSVQQVDANDLMTLGNSWASTHSKFAGMLTDTAWTQPVIHLRGEFLSYGEAWWRIFRSEYRSAKREFAAMCLTDPPTSNPDRLAVLDAIIQCQELVRRIRENRELGMTLFPKRWKDERSDWTELSSILQWVTLLKHEIKSGALPDSVIGFFNQPFDAERIATQAATVEHLFAAYQELLDELLFLLDFDSDLRFGPGKQMSDLAFEKQRTILTGFIENAPRIQEIVSYRHQCHLLEEAGCAGLIEQADEWDRAGDLLLTFFRWSWYGALVDDALNHRRILGSFDGASHSQTVEHYQQLDLDLIRFNRARLALQHWEKLPHNGNLGQMGILRREFQKKRRHLPIRKLVDAAGSAMQAIKPVFMMSPMSVATYLPQKAIEFDLVVFDEASQVKPVDALGALMRANQAVVVGDSKQLPPTSFFDSMFVDEESDASTSDMESVLGLFLAQGVPQRMLRWHYRSRHESLITVSNREFYENGLVTFPSPQQSRSEFGVIYHHLPDSYYDRGGKRTNRGEAVTIAQAVMKHAREKPHLTLGVAAFSTAQAGEIRDQIELRRKNDPSCESFFNGNAEEPFFVKNLENVQGDERDVILISVGYGRDATGNLTMNFGPLNTEGGERRLNVLITRARCRCEVFTNLRPEDLDERRTNARGVLSLKRYLQFAAEQIHEEELPESVPVSEFEQELADSLTSNGHVVHRKIGASEYRIDLAMVDPDDPGRYLAGIVCDGPTYRSARTARDRDRIRTSVLSGLGWNLVRIWSTDWFFNPARSLNEIEEAVMAAKNKTTSKQPLPNASRHELVREDNSDDLTSGNASIPYVIAEIRPSAQIDPDRFYLAPRKILTAHIDSVVHAESPVHFDEAARRILNAYQIQRIGRRIRERLLEAVSLAERQGDVRFHDGFLYHPDETMVQVRDRSSLPASSRKLEYVSPDEITAGMMQIVEESFGIPVDDAARELTRRLGFAATSEQMRNRIGDVIGELVRSGDIEFRSGLLHSTN